MGAADASTIEWATSAASPWKKSACVFPVLAYNKAHIVSEHNIDGDIRTKILDFCAHISHICPFTPLVVPFQNICTKAYNTSTQSWERHGSVISVNTVGPLLWVDTIDVVSEEVIWTVNLLHYLKYEPIARTSSTRHLVCTRNVLGQTVSS